VLTSEALVHGIVIGSALLALWFYVRLGEQRRPSSLLRVCVHAVVAGIGLTLAPSGMRWIIGDSESPSLAAAALFGLFLPAMTYVFLSALFVFERLQRALYTR
jgi:xanthine/uracil permease